jgi:hypothetical protein
MPSVSNANFGPFVSYLIPGGTVLLGVSPFSPLLQSWFATTPANAPNLDGMLYLTVAALAAGMTVSAVRWALIDTLHSLTGVPLPQLDFSKLGRNVDAFLLLIDIHYKHYLFYSNMVVALAVAYGCYRAKVGGLTPLGGVDVAFVALEAIFVATSRDTLRKYYSRGQQLLATRGRREK